MIICSLKPAESILFHFHLLMTNELTILEETKENKNKFHPLQYWISPLLSGEDYQISFYVNQIQPGLRRTKVYGEPKTLHIGTYNDVLEQSNSNLYYISLQMLEDAALTYKLTHFQISECFRQCLSLCLKGLCFAASNSFDKQEFANIVEKVSLLGGKFVSINEVNKINAFITNVPLLPPSITFVRQDIKFIKSEWVEECFKQIERLEFDDYIIQNFESLSISSSDLEPYQSKQLKEKVLKGNGIWKETLDSSVTFLIASHFSSTPKVKLALQMSVPIVNPKWIYSQSRNFCSIKPYIMNFWVLPDYQKSMLFSEKTFAIHVDCEDRNCVIEAIKAHSGSFSTTPDYLIVPHFFQTALDKKCVTVSWIWFCITEKKIISPESSILYRPFPYQKVSSKLKGFVVVLYKIENESTRYEISECLRTLGIIVHYKASSKANVIVVNEADDKIINAAKRYKTQIVSFSWVIKLVNTGKLPSFNNYLVETQKDIALKTIYKGIKNKKSSELPNDQFPLSQFNNNESNILTQEMSLNVFSDDDDNDDHNMPSVDITYETTAFTRKKNKYNNDPLLEILSKCDL